MSFSENDINHFVDLAKKAALLAEPILLKYFGQLDSVDEKYQAGLVTHADLESEQVITNFFKKETPGFDFIGEEATYQRGGGIKSDAAGQKPCWIVDPLDGTTNYVHGFPIFCISIGLYFQGKSYVGVIHAPAMKQLFFAGKGQGAWLNNRQIRVSPRKSINEALVSTGFVTSHKEKLQSQLQVFNKVISEVRAIRRPGAAAYDLAMVASGVFDVFWEENLNAWDTCAGVALVEEAGGRVTQMSGDAYDPFCPNIFASNNFLHATFESLFQ